MKIGNEQNSKVKIFVLVKNVSYLNESLNYLKKINYDFVLFSDFSTLICRMYQEQPDCIFISSEVAQEDHHGFSVISLQTEFEIVGYAEQNLISSIMRLNAMPVRYKLRPPFTGAAAYRIIQKMIFDRKPLAM